ncbi:MAG TPA: metal-dependent hydrolase [Vicinamibacterales bacterium]|nr:metal-dependent hydrolase [Vicinamibacterales bacterium]
MQLPSDTSPGDAAGKLTATWLGHSTFLIQSPDGVRLMFDPWLTGNPSCPEKSKKIGALELMLITHGHEDHTGDAVNVARATGASVVANYELAGWLERQGLRNVRGMNIGGRDRVNGLDITMVQALHSSSAADVSGNGGRVYLGVATGFIVRFDSGVTIYFAGDTGLFGDMKMFRERYAPSIAFLPIGDRYTMGPEDAAIAGEWLGVKRIVPMHYGTFPELTGTPEQLRECCGPRGIEVVELRPGQATLL